MSARARENLASLWKDLEFFTVRRVRSHSETYSVVFDLPPAAGPELTKLARRTSVQQLGAVPEELLPYARPVTRVFRAVTTNGLTFDSSGYSKLDLSIDRTFTFGRRWANHTTFVRKRDTPQPGDVICGVRGPGANRWSRQQVQHWFPCDDALRLLIETVRGEHDLLTEDELGFRLLTTDGFADTLFAIARLVFFDNVQAFVDGVRLNNLVQYRRVDPSLAMHPAFGRTYGDGLVVSWQGMSLNDGYDQVLHELSHALGEPDWWATFLRLTEEQGVYHAHPGPHDVCRACEHECPTWVEDGFPYQPAHWRRPKRS